MSTTHITAEYLAERRQAVRELRARLAAGENEATAAHALGFATQADVNRDVAAILNKRSAK